MNYTSSSIISTVTANNTNVTLTEEELEQYEFDYYLKKYPLAVVFLIILAVVGGIGNFHALLIYFFRYKRSPKRIFVLFLAFVDLLACWLVIPFEIFDLRYSLTFHAVAPCKIFRFLNHFVSVGSGLFLGVIALEIHRKVCSPFKRQMSESCAKKTAVVTVSVAVALSIPGFVLYGPSDKMTDINIVGSDCTVLSKYKQSMFYWGYTGVFLVISTLLFILCVVAYIRVGRAIYKQLVFRKKALVKPNLQKRESKSLCESKSFRVSFDVKESRTTDTTLELDSKECTDQVIREQNSTCADEILKEENDCTIFNTHVSDLKSDESDEISDTCTDKMLTTEKNPLNHTSFKTIKDESADEIHDETCADKMISNKEQFDSNHTKTAKFENEGNDISDTFIKAKLYDNTKTNTLKIENEINGTRTDKVIPKKNKPKSKRFTFDRSKRITMMFLIATAVSYSGILPYCIITLVKIFNNRAYQNAKDALGQFMAVLLRGYFLNNASNSVVYFIMDTRLRIECKHMYVKLYRLICRKE